MLVYHDVFLKSFSTKLANESVTSIKPREFQHVTADKNVITPIPQCFYRILQFYIIYEFITKSFEGAFFEFRIQTQLEF